MKTPVLELVEVSEVDTPAAPEINDAFWALDTIVQLTVQSITDITPPVAPIQGDRYIIPSGATGVWTGRTNRVAYYTVTGWRYRTPRDGWFAWVRDEQKEFRFKASDNEWIEHTPTGGGVTGEAEFPVFAPGTPTISLLLAKYALAKNYTLPGNMSGSKGDAGTNPTSSFVLDVSVDGSPVGTITISTAGVFTFATTSGEPIALIAGQFLEVTAPASTDGTVADIALSLVLVGGIVGTGRNTKLELGMFFVDEPTSNQLLFKYVATRELQFNEDFNDAFGDIGINPTGTYVLTVSIAGTDIGTITISSGGVFTFATDGGAVIPMHIGEVLTIAAPSSTDATAAEISVTLIGTLV